jgi:hypothetical protein
MGILIYALQSYMFPISTIGEWFAIRLRLPIVTFFRSEANAHRWLPAYPPEIDCNQFEVSVNHWFHYHLFPEFFAAK